MMKLNFWSDQTNEEIAVEINNCIQSLQLRLANTTINSNIIDETETESIELWFSETVFDVQVASALQELFCFIAETRERKNRNRNKNKNNRMKTKTKKKNNNRTNYSYNTIATKCPIIVSRFQLDRCPGNFCLNESIRLALELDVVGALCVDGRLGSYDLLASRYSPLASLSTMVAVPVHLKELDLRYFKLSSREMIGRLRNGILNPALRKRGGGLQRLSLCNSTFANDRVFEGFAEALSLLSSKPPTTIPEDDRKQHEQSGRYLEVLWLYYCNLEDRHLEGVLRSLMNNNAAATTNANFRMPTTETTTMALVDSSTIVMPLLLSPITDEEQSQERIVAPPTTRNTLKSLTIEQGKCGDTFYALLGAWLLQQQQQQQQQHYQSHEIESMDINPYHPNIITCSNTNNTRYHYSQCSLETVNIFIWSSCIPNRTAPDPVVHLTRHFTTTQTKNTKTNNKTSTTSSTPYYTNQTLRTLRLSGVVDMACLGRLISEHLLGLEMLQLHSFGTNDAGIQADGFSRFVAAAANNTSNNNINNNINNNSSNNDINNNNNKKHTNNFSLRTLNFHCPEKTTRTELESSPQLIKLLDRYPMLHDVKFGFKRNGSWKDIVQQKMNANAAGRFLFVPNSSKGSNSTTSTSTSTSSTTTNDLSMALWPTVLEGFHNKLLLESDSLYDDRVRGWVESGSFGGDDSDDSESSDLLSDDEDSEEEDDDGDGSSDDDDDDDGDNSNAFVAVVSRNKCQSIEQTASAIFSLLKPNMERLLRLQRPSLSLSSSSSSSMQLPSPSMNHPTDPAIVHDTTTTITTTTTAPTQTQTSFSGTGVDTCATAVIVHKNIDASAAFNIINTTRTPASSGGNLLLNKEFCKIYSLQWDDSDDNDDSDDDNDTSDDEDGIWKYCLNLNSSLNLARSKHSKNHLNHPNLNSSPRKRAIRDMANWEAASARRVKIR